MIFNFILTEKQKGQIINNEFAPVLNNFIKFLDKNEISNVREIEGPFSNGNKELYLIHYDKRPK